MKKIMGILLICILCFTGCGTDTDQNKSTEVKKSKIEVYSAQSDEFIKTIDQQDIVNELLKMEDWKDTENIGDDLTPEYKLLVYQEKTLLLGEDPDEEREYELIETMITFENSSYIEGIISSDIIKNMKIPENVMTFYYEIPEAAIENFRTWKRINCGL